MTRLSHTLQLNKGYHLLWMKVAKYPASGGTEIIVYSNTEKSRKTYTANINFVLCGLGTLGRLFRSQVAVVVVAVTVPWPLRTELPAPANSSWALCRACGMCASCTAWAACAAWCCLVCIEAAKQDIPQPRSRVVIRLTVRFESETPTIRNWNKIKVGHVGSLKRDGWHVLFHHTTFLEVALC